MTDAILGSMQGKRRYRQYRARVGQLPDSYATAIVGLERYLEFFGPGGSGRLLSMLEDLLDLFEQSAADQTPVRVIVGEDPVEFAEAFLQNYPAGEWISRERRRLAGAIDVAAAQQQA